MYIYIKSECITSYLKIGFSIFALILVLHLPVCGQVGLNPKEKSISFFEKADSLNRKRLVPSTIFGAVSYTGFSIGLYNAWYKNFDQEPFHFFDDRREWNYMDKYGHFYTAYFQGVLVYKGAKWTGLTDKNSILTGFFLGTLFQSTIEVMDGFSSKWGFSKADVAMNFAGSGAFVVQQKFWGEQRIHFKMSNIPQPYSDQDLQSINSDQTTTLQNRADNLFGTTFPERFLKDYNSQIYWACLDIKKFVPHSSFPKWLNIAVGYGAGNLFGGYENIWTEGTADFDVSSLNPRYSRILLSPDINLSAIRTKSHFFNTLLDVADVFHLPLPALEYNTLGEFHFHFFL